MKKEFFYAKYTNGKIETRGINSCLLGHKINHSPNKKADGVYVQWRWDNNRLIVENDRHGMYPSYYYYKDNEICISPSLTQILAECGPCELDYRALSIFLRLGFFIREDTPFKFIRALPPDVHFQWENSKLTISSTRHIDQKSIEISRKDAIDRYIYLFRQSIKRRLPANENFAVPLSGGRDSRHILLELLNLGYKPKFCITFEHFPPRSDEDARIAKLVTNHLGLINKVIRQDRSYFKAEVQNNIITNFCADEHSQYLKIANYLENNIQTFYDGIGSGDVFSAGHFLNKFNPQLFESAQYSKLAARILKSYDEYIWSSILSEDIYRKVNLELAVDYLSAELKMHSCSPNPISSFYFWNRTRREIALSPYSIFANIPAVYSPYLDYDLFDFLSSLNYRFLLDRGFHTETILKAYPEAADLPFEDKAAPEKSPVALHRGFLIEFLPYVIRHAKNFQKFFKADYVIPRLIYSYFRDSHWHLRPEMMLYLLQLNEKCLDAGNARKFAAYKQRNHYLELSQDAL